MDFETVKKPNVLWIVVDCLRADRCPVEDEAEDLVGWSILKDKGTCFSQAVSAASITPVSFGSMFTSQRHFRHGIYSLQGPSLNSDVKTIAEYFAENGYYTKGLMTGPLYGPFGLDKGFLSYDVRPNTDNLFSQWGDDLPAMLEDTLSSDMPTFTLLHLFELHEPIKTQDDHGIKKRSYKLYDIAWQQLDEKLSKIYSLIPDDTIVVLTSDHGEVLKRRSSRSLPDYLMRKLRGVFHMPHRPQDWLDHGFFPYDELHRIPLAITGPGVPAGQIIDQQVRHIDIMPTLMELCGIDVPENVCGRSLVSMMSGQDVKDVPAYLYTGWCDGPRYWHGIRTVEDKYIEPAGPLSVKSRSYYFSLKDDPDEKKNVINKSVGYKTSAARVKLIDILNDTTSAVGSTEKPVAKKHFSKAQHEELAGKLESLGYI